MADRLAERHKRFFLGAEFPAAMPRTIIPTSLAPGGETGIGSPLSFAAGDVDLGLRIRLGRRPVVVFAWNTTASPQTVYIQSSPDPYGRLGDVSDDPIAPGELRMFGPYLRLAWVQPDGHLYVDVDDDGVLIAAVEI